MVQSQTSLAPSRPWRFSLKSQYYQELSHLEKLPLSQKNAPVLIGTGMGRDGYFELAWSIDKQVLMVWATSNTWNYILHKIIKYDSLVNQYNVDLVKKNHFLSQISKHSTRPYLRLYPLSLQRSLFGRVQPWKNQPIDYCFGKWVELAYLLPSYINFRFGSQLQLARYRGTQKLELALQYANEARKYLNSRGCLIGYEVGESGLWLDGNPIYLPHRNFRLIWGLGGRSDFAIRADDNSVEYWEIKTRSLNRPVSKPEDLVTPTYLKQITQQAPMQLIYPSGYQLPNIIPVTTIGVLGIGCNQHGNVISYTQKVSSTEKSNNLLDYPRPSSFQESRITERQVLTIRAAQWYKQLDQLDNSNSERVELAARVLEEAVNQLVEALMKSDEWDSILQALDDYWQRKWGALRQV